MYASPGATSAYRSRATEANPTEVAREDVEVVERRARRRRTLMPTCWRMAEQRSSTALGRRGDVRREAVDGRRAARRGTRDRAFVEVVERRPESRPRRAMRS